MLELEEGTLVAAVAVASLLQQLDVDNVEVMMTLEDYSMDLPTIHPVALKTIRHHYYYYLMTCSYPPPLSGRMLVRMSLSLMTRMEQQQQQQQQL